MKCLTELCDFPAVFKTPFPASPILLLKPCSKLACMETCLLQFKNLLPGTNPFMVDKLSRGHASMTRERECRKRVE